MAIQQGNYLEPRAVEKLEIGMTRSQVRYLLGTPMVPDTFDTDRWDYIYYLKKGRVRKPGATQAHRFLRSGQSGAGRRKKAAKPHPKTEPPAGGRSRRLAPLVGLAREPAARARAAVLARIVRQGPIDLDPVSLPRHVTAGAQLAKNPDRRAVPGHIERWCKTARRSERILNARLRRQLHSP